MLPIAILTLSGILLLAISLSYKFESFITEPSIIFMNPYEVQTFMSMDKDHYVEQMSPADFQMIILKKVGRILLLLHLKKKNS
jgi:hypothetical protein